MTEDIETSTEQPKTDTLPGAEPPPAAATGGSGGSAQERAVALASERPEVAAGAAFAGGFILALILKRIAR